jgi:hypothetical protein
MLREILAITSIVVIASLLCYPLFAIGNLEGHDVWNHLLWAHQWLSSFRLGIIYPQWMPDAYHGCGNATFIFYPPFLFFTYAFINIFTNDIYTVISVSAWIGLCASGIAMFAFSRIHFSKIHAFIAAVAYMALPYHLIDLYVRTALAEFWSFVWIPLIALFILKIDQRGICGFVCLSACFAGLVFTHLPSALLSVIFFEAFIIFLYYKGRSARLFIWRQTALILGVGLSAAYLIPALFEQRYVNIRQLSQARVEDNFLFTGAGYFITSLNYAALEIVLVVALGLIISLTLHSEKSQRRTNSYVVFYSISGMVCFFAMLKLSTPIWEMIPLIQKIQFPWRILAIATFCASISIGFISQTLFLPKRQDWKKRIIFGLLLFGIIEVSFRNAYAELPFFRGAYFEKVRKALKPTGWQIGTGQSSQDLTENYNLYLQDIAEKYGRYIKSNPWLIDSLEYKPRWAILKDLPEKSLCKPGSVYDTCGPYIIFPPREWLETYKFGDAETKIPLSLQNDRIYLATEVGANEGSHEIILWDPEKRRFKIDVNQSARIIVRTFYYTRWKAYENGRSLPIKPDPATGLISIEIPKGIHTIDLLFEPGPYRITGIGISLASLFALGILSIIRITTAIRRTSIVSV